MILPFEVCNFVCYGLSALSVLREVAEGSMRVIHEGVAEAPLIPGLYDVL